MPYHILSLDGGGVRGVLTTTLLSRLVKEVPDLLDRVDLFAGTSSGGILALGLAAGRRPDECCQVYEASGAKVFEDSIFDNLKDLGNLRGAQYSNQNLKQTLTDQFGEMTLGDLPKRVLIVSFDLDNEATGPGELRSWKPKMFHNFPGQSSDAGEKIVDVALRTSAAPTYFPIYQGYIDGGLAATNPRMCAVARAVNPSSGHRLEDLRLLSISTGRLPHYLEVQDADWGLAQWAPHLLGLITEANIGVPDYQCQQILDDRYYRLDPTLPHFVRLDDIRQAHTLREWAQVVDLAPVLDWLKTHF